MFANYSNPASAYQAVSVNSAVNTADPHRLIELLFDGAITAISIAKGAMQQKDIPAKGKAISKAIDIVENGLKACLDFEKGSDIASNLDALYEYILNRLLYANLKNDLAALDETSHLLSEIRSAWQEIRPKFVSE